VLNAANRGCHTVEIMCVYGVNYWCWSDDMRASDRAFSRVAFNRVDEPGDCRQ
jgi:hypothetical protein